LGEGREQQVLSLVPFTDSEPSLSVEQKITRDTEKKRDRLV